MSPLEKAGAWIGIIGFVAAVAVAWANLNNRLDKMDDKIAGIEKTLGSAACNAILPRQIEAIEKNHQQARESLEALSRQYDCGPHHDVADWDIGALGNAMNAVDSHASNLSAQLNAIDVQLNNETNR
jgi:hypothetical protein